MEYLAIGVEFVNIYRFDAGTARSIDQFNSHDVGITPILRMKEKGDFLHIGCIHLQPDSVLGFHPAGCPQLFLVVSGSGWVRNDISGKVPVFKGQAVYWEEGEGHESGSETGMIAIVIEAPEMHPEQWMVPIEKKR
jgi:quercetin dioxygenase-like cupin family protein